MFSFLSSSVMGSFFKGLFSDKSALLTPLIILLLILAFFNAPTILEKIGYETKGQLKNKVMELDKKNNKLSLDNLALSEKLSTLEEYMDRMDVVMEKHQDIVSTLDEEAYLENTKHIEKILELEKQVVYSDSNTSPPVVSVSNQISRANIESLHETFNRLF